MTLFSEPVHIRTTENKVFCKPTSQAKPDSDMNGMACVSRSFAIASRKLVMSRKVQITRSCVNMTFIEEANKNKVAVEAKIGKSVLDIAIENNIDIEGACGGELACSTCHVILDQALFDKLPPKTEEEEDMLDLAWGLTDT